MNRRKGILMLLVAGFCFLGSLPVYWLETQYAHGLMRERLEAQMDESQLQKFEFQVVDGTVTDPGFALIEDGRELRYHGHYYDIFKVAEVNGKRVYWVLSDELEDAMLTQLQTKSAHDGTGDSAAKTFLKFFGKSFPSPVMAAFVSTQVSSVHACALVAPMPQIDLDILSPPPQA